MQDLGITLSRLEKKLPTVFVLGQFYTGGNPLNTLKENLDLADVNNGEFLGALDSAGLAYQTKTLIIIDAINEGSARAGWEDFISGLFSDIASFDNIGIIVSCRSTYFEYLVPKTVVNTTPKITHEGFKGHEYRAAALYLGEQGIAMPSTPILSPEFTNLLFLKTCAKALKAQELKEFPSGLQGVSNIFDFYVESLEYKISRVKGYRTGELVVKKALEGFALSLFPNSQHGKNVPDAIETITKFDPKQNSGERLYDLLLHEGVIAEDLDYDPESESYKPIIRFTYERFSDYKIATSLLSSFRLDHPETSLDQAPFFHELLQKDHSFRYLGILQALGVIIPEEHNVELVDLLPKGFNKSNSLYHILFEKAFIESLEIRHLTSFTDRTLELFKDLKVSIYSDKKLDILLTLSTRIGHPWNAETLHNKLSAISLSERDRSWTTHISISDYEGNDELPRSTINIIVSWAISGKIKDIEPEVARLCCIVLIWMFSTSNRKLRDKATKSATRLLSQFPELLAPILDKFSSVDDLYIQERLYAVAYGVSLNINNLAVVKSTAEWVWKYQFEDQQPVLHLLIRDYARGIMEYALHKGLLDESTDPTVFRPPYLSELPIIEPSVAEIEVLSEQDGFKFFTRSVLWGDFGKSNMSLIHDWSPTEIGKEPQTNYALQMEFAKKWLTEGLRQNFIDYLDSELDMAARPIDYSNGIRQIEFVSPKESNDKKPSKQEPLFGPESVTKI